MKFTSLRGWLFLLLGVVTITLGCEDNEVDLFSDVQNNPVIYGLLQTTIGDNQYVRVERSFGDPDRGALTLAQDENEVYFSDIDVILQNRSSGASASLRRVDAVDLGYERVPGDFLIAPNYLYELRPNQMALRDGDNVRISINREDEALATADIKMLPSTRLLVPSLVSGRRVMSFDTIQSTLLRWLAVEGSDLYVIRYEMDVLEDNRNTGEVQTRTVVWDMTRLINIPGTTDARSTQIDGRAFFDFLSSEFDPVPGMVRQFVDGRLILEIYGDELQSYIDVINANLGITSSQDIPVFSNVDGGYGLFTSLSRNVFPDVRLSSNTVRLTSEVAATRDLGFVP